eukprot:s3671_g2.t2
MTGAHQWQRADLHSAAEGRMYVYTPTDGYEKDVVLTSPVFTPSQRVRYLHFSFHITDDDIGSLRLETMGSSGWTQLWSRTAEQGSRSQWILALVVLPQDATAIRFVGSTTELKLITPGYMALDAIGVGLPLVNILQLSCPFSLDTCLWYNAGATSWQLAGQGGADGWLEATRSGAQGQEYILQTAAVFNTTEEKFLVVAYQLSGSDSVALELQHRSSAGDWQLLLSDSGPRYTSWHQASVVVPSGTVGLRLVANITNELDVVTVESLLVVGSAEALADVSCGFEAGSCNWTGPWLRHSGLVEGPTGPDEAFLIFTSPRILLLSDVAYLEFAYHMWGLGIGLLELQCLRDGQWIRVWSRFGSQGRDWLQAKVMLPALSEMLRFMHSGFLSGDGDVALDALLAWEPAAAPTSYLSMCSGVAHSCALLHHQGLVKCWGFGGSGRLGYGSQFFEPGQAPNQMGAALPAVELSQPERRVRATQVACGLAHSCAVLETGDLKCWGDNSFSQACPGHDDGFCGDLPFQMGGFLPAIDLGGVNVLQVAPGTTHTCALLQGGVVKCFGEGLMLGLGDVMNRGDFLEEMGTQLPTVDLGTNFEAVQLVAGEYHTCALSRRGAVKCWGSSGYLGLGKYPGSYVGTGPGEMGDALPELDLGAKLPVLQLAAGDRHTCAVRVDGVVRCWGANLGGELGHGSTETAGDEPGEMGINLPVTDLGEGSRAVRIASGGSHTCAILQDASLKCWGGGNQGQLGQGNTENLGDEPSEMGSALRAVDVGLHGVRDVACGGYHTCVLLDDDSIRCWGANDAGQLGLGNTVNVGDLQGQMGAALVPTELFVVLLGAGDGLEGLSLLPGASTGLLQLSHNGSLGLVCDDGFDQAAAQVACRDLGMAGGEAFSEDAGADGAGTIMADNIKCTGQEVSLRDCRFRGWHVHDCSVREAAGIRCQLDAWSEYTTAGGPDGRQDSSMVWDIETQSALLFGGHASNAFLYFEDLWRYDWLQRAWREIRPIGPKPSTRSGHAAVWDPQSRSMIIFAGHFLASFYDDLWQFLEEGSWKLVAVAPAPQAPQARAYHTAILDTVENALLAFGGQGESSQVLGDLWRYSLVERQWSQLATGPGARSRHSAVWAALTRQMLVFAGWSGEQYLQDLRYYDASADRWGEVLAAGHWPAARNGHATAWDPVSKSMLVMGGTQNASDVLSYTNSLYNFSLLSGLWHEEGLQAGVPRPSGRTALAMVWDEKSRGLFAFGGFNASYLQQSWRYAVSQTDPPFVVRCELGSNCSFRFRNAAGIGAKHVCSDSDFLDGLFFVVSEENDWSLESPHLLLEPGHHRLCACESSCSHPRDYQVAIGYFLVEGPYSDQSAQCYLGSVCTINAWRGVGISVNDSVVMQSRCMRSSEASTNYPWERAIGVSFNETYGWHSLQVGLLEKTGKPETVELCWCPKSSACRSAADFLVVALRLEILCPPGEHSGGQSCLLCPADHFCPGGVELQSCPFASTSQPGSRELSDCKCLQGHYWTGSACLLCPAGSSTSQASSGVCHAPPRNGKHGTPLTATSQEGATSLDSCTCLAGFVNTQPDNPAACEACGVGFFCPGSSQSRQPCGPFQTTASEMSPDPSHCVCEAGRFLDGGSCALCPVGRFKTTIGDFSCEQCGAGTSHGNSTGRIEPCRCRPGYGFAEETAQCTVCPPGEYKSTVGNALCSRCASDKTSMQAATSVLDCSCRAGLAAQGSLCRDCKVGFFCPGGGEERQCPHGATSRARSEQQVDCSCLPGFFFRSDGCWPCPEGFYKEGEGNDAFCPRQCPTNSNSTAGSTGPLNCFCDSGYYAEVHTSGFIIRCIDCTILPNMLCLGGLEDARLLNETGFHSLPVAEEGFFQTGMAMAIKCRVRTAEGDSACMGSQPVREPCLNDPNTSKCTGLDGLGNRCAAGSEGMLCGECPVGWARNSFQAPCQQCQSSQLTLAFSLLFDIFSKAGLNFIVASMAATAAVRGNGKLHTSMIRIAVQWFAACSVIQVFDLDQLQTLAFQFYGAGASGAGSAAILPWPPWVQDAIRDLLDFFSLVQLQLSVQFSLHCVAAAAFPSQPSEAQNEALAIYFLCLPFFTTLATVTLCALAVYVLVPLAKLQGFAFNRVEKRRWAKLKVMQKLKDALEPTLQACDLSWDDVEDSGMLEVSLTALQEALTDPSMFLQRGAAASPQFLLCALRREARELGFGDVAAPKQLVLGAAQDALEAAEEEDFKTFLARALGLLLERLETEGRGDLAEFECEESKEEPGGGRSTVKSVDSINIQKDLDVDAEMDALDFGLFHAKPNLRVLIYQSMPVVWIGLSMAWPVLLSGFLRLLWCVPIPEGDSMSTLRLLPSPDIICSSDAHELTATLALTGLLVWCLGIPLALFLRVLALRDRHAPETYRRYGYFIQGYEPQFWYWELVVKRIDVGLVMLFTYTAVVPDPEAKLLLLPLLSGFQSITTAWLKPYANSQNQILDFVDVYLGTVRFILFSCIAALLILRPGERPTHALAACLLCMLLATITYLALHVLVQFLRHAAVDDSLEGTQLAKLSSFRRAALQFILLAFQPADSENIRLKWSFEDAVISATSAPISPSLEAGSATSRAAPRSKSWLALRSLRASVLRFGPASQDKALLKANEEFTAFLLQELGQRELPSESGKLLCALATAGRNLSTLAKTRVGKAWLEAVLAMDEAGHCKVCAPEDLERAVARLRQMPGKDAQQLIFFVARLCAEHVVMAGLVRKGATLPDDPSQVLSSLRKTLLSEWAADKMVEGFARDADDTEEVEEVAVEAGSLEQDVVAASPQSASQNEDQLLQV